MSTTCTAVVDGERLVANVNDHNIDDGVLWMVNFTINVLHDKRALTASATFNTRANNPVMLIRYDVADEMVNDAIVRGVDFAQAKSPGFATLNVLLIDLYRSWLATICDKVGL